MEETVEKRMPERLQMQDVVFVFRRFWRFLLLLPCFCTAMCVGVVLATVPASYTGSMKLMAALPAVPGGSVVTYDRLLAAERLADTDVQVIQSDSVLREVKKRLKLPMPVTELAAHISVRHIQQTQVLLLSVSAGTPKRAEQIARTAAQVAADELGRLPDAGTIQVLSDVQVASVRPDLRMIAVFSYGAGWIFALFVIFCRTAWRKEFSTAQDVERRTGLPVLASLPHVRAEWRGKCMAVPTGRKKPLLGQAVPPSFEEACWTLAFRLSLILPEKPRRVVIAGAQSGEGRTTTAFHLAKALADQKQRVLLMETDFRHPVLASDVYIASASSAGLADMLEKAVPCTDQILFLPEYGFSVLPAGRTLPSPMCFLNTPYMQHLLEELADAYDWILMDSPPLCSCADAAALGHEAEGVVLVVRACATPENAFQRACDQLSGAKVRILGCVLNDCGKPNR